MKKVNYLLIVPILYSITLLFTKFKFANFYEINLPDALIVGAFCALYGFLKNLEIREVQAREKTEAAQIEEEIRVEQLKLNLEHIRERAVQEKAIRDSRASISGLSGKEFKF